jgi:hypothetical protein
MLTEPLNGTSLRRWGSTLYHYRSKLCFPARIFPAGPRTRMELPINEIDGCKGLQPSRGRLSINQGPFEHQHEDEPLVANFGERLRRAQSKTPPRCDHRAHRASFSSPRYLSERATVDGVNRGAIEIDNVLQQQPLNLPLPQA